MTIREFVAKGVGATVAKAVGASVLNSFIASRESEDSSTSSASSAWAEIEQKLHGLFGSSDKSKGAAERRSSQFATTLFIVLGLVLIAYLFGRRQGRGRATVLEVHKA